MGSALSAGVSGLKAHQAMLDVAGNNLANVNTVGFKGSSVTFAELLSQTLRRASGPSSNLGGVNPQQMGSGVGIASIRVDTTQGNIVSTGQDLDVAIDGSGYFVLNNGSQNVYTRIGSFAVDAGNTLVDPATGYRVQRIGNYGESEGFQTAGDTSIHIPWDASMPARATTEIALNGNLRASAEDTSATANKIMSNLALTTGNGERVATANTFLSDLDQWVTPLAEGETGTIRISGVLEDGTVFTDEEITWTGAAPGSGPTVQDLLDQITALFNDSTASLNSDGKIVLTANQSGYNLGMITNMTYVPADSDELTLPTFFDYVTIGGNDTKNFKITVYDNMGEQHVLSGTFVKTDATNTWDLVIDSITGEMEGSWSTYDIHNSSALNRRISGIEFNPDGSFKGISIPGEEAVIGVQFENNPSAIQTIQLVLGTPGEFTGLTQFASQQSSAAALTQDGYAAGSLSNVTIDQTGMIVGTFTNGVKVNIAALQVGIFQNAGGLESIGNGYFLPTANSGEAIATMAASGGAGKITGQSLEQSNVDIATEFVTLMQAQNGYQANARTIRVANEVLNELTNLIR
ncbi:MAG TPA: flagellar hook-basal body complex protein [Anaerohalosphaeraceae bacterium]|jgi:flagellar hook protein FlgE|nr:flagellar hook-basal body complex protein [Anaerohalosphaeraceae bacterium]HQG04684.1 flagellar hook-basal body complex protein [Anaerohalosphaeraceae bacterium]HQI06486.1 flagellar hook-basal body complex protein [Anaerohalosphaeraceae bacterium]HQJ66779.1 flagellar hook-basal body complex protein [Anaerohalosphaeraceae bacterium]